MESVPPCSGVLTASVALRPKYHCLGRTDRVVQIRVSAKLSAKLMRLSTFVFVDKSGPSSGRSGSVTLLQLLDLGSRVMAWNVA